MHLPTLPGHLIAAFGLKVCERSEKYLKVNENTENTDVYVISTRVQCWIYFCGNRTALDFVLPQNGDLRDWRMCAPHNRASRDIVNVILRQHHEVLYEV